METKKPTKEKVLTIIGWTIAMLTALSQFIENIPW